MRFNKRILERILNIIYDSPLGITIEDIVNVSGHHRLTVQKYVSMLEKLGFATTRRLGHYILVFPTIIIRNINNDLSSLILFSLVRVLSEELGFSEEKLFRLGVKIGEKVSMRITSDIKEYFRKLGEEIYELTNIPLPITTSKFSVKIHQFKDVDKVVYIELSFIPPESKSISNFCQFMAGYIMGILGSILPLRRVELIEHSESSKLVCKYIAILKKPISTIITELNK